MALTHDEALARTLQLEKDITELLRAAPPLELSDEGELQPAEVFPTRWVQVIEWCDLDGERWLAVMKTDGMEPWEVEGILSHAVRHVC